MLKNVTLSAEEEIIHQAREKARREHTTLNEQFRRWLERYVKTDRLAPRYAEMMEQLAYADPGRRFTREELNER